MGSGKSAVGKQLARRLQRPFIDSDAEIKRRTGVDIPQIFEREGEPGFRQRECAVIADLLQRSGVVLATGGGAVLLEANRRALQQGGTVIYLETSVSQQVERVGRSEHRPLLRGAPDLVATLSALLAQRAPLYAAVAAITVATDGQQVQQVVDAILRQLPE